MYCWNVENNHLMIFTYDHFHLWLSLTNISFIFDNQFFYDLFIFKAFSNSQKLISNSLISLYLIYLHTTMIYMILTDLYGDFGV